MADDAVQMTEYEALAAEFQRLSGPLDASVQYIQDGIEMEDFRQTRPGKVIIGRSVKSLKHHLELVLDPNVSGQDLLNAVAELRVQHRVLESISETVNVGRIVTRRITQEDSELENPDEQ